MRAFLWFTRLAALLGLTIAVAGAAAPAVTIVLGAEPSDIERYAASELSGYLEKLYGLESTTGADAAGASGTVFLIGRPGTNAAVKTALGADGWPQVSDQGIVLKRARWRDQPALVVGGGSDAATLWAVYELVQRWGVRYLLRGDVLPAEPGPFRLPAEDAVIEPQLKVREWRVINDFACGPESWGLSDYRPVLDQLAKLRFNRICASIYPWQPFLDFEVKGVKRQRATLWYDFHYPITPDMPGRQIFGDVKEFWNPDLPQPGAGYAAMAAAGEKLVHGIFAHARRRGMECAITATLMEFPPEFAPLLKDTLKVHQLGSMGVVPGPTIALDDPALTELTTAILQATANTYPEVDYIILGMPEHRQWIVEYERAWRALDARYGVEKICPLASALDASQHRQSYPSGKERALNEVKGDIVTLYFYDRLLRDLQVMKSTRRPDMKFIFIGVAEELFPALPKLIPPGSELLNFVDYTASRIVARREVLKRIPTGEIPNTLIYTLHDDNVGLLPQLTTGSLHELTKDLRDYGWAGFYGRYWLISDHDLCLAYLSRAAWRADATPEGVYRDHLTALGGKAWVEDMLTALRELEATTVALEWHGLGLAFPVPGMILKHWKPGEMSAELAGDRAGYERALAAARRAQATATGPGKSYADYWVGRLEFGRGYLDAVEAARRAATAEAEKNPAEALRQAELALAATRRALDAYSAVANNQSDRGAIATMAEYMYRPLQEKVAQFRKL